MKEATPYRVNARLTVAEHERLTRMVEETGLTVSDIVRMLIRQAQVIKYPVKARRIDAGERRGE